MSDTLAPYPPVTPIEPLIPQAADRITAFEATSTKLETIGEGKKIVWRSWGKGVPIVLLHGGSGSWRHWIKNIPVLAQKYRVIAADLPAFGDSEVPDEPEIGRMSRSVVAGIDTLIGADTNYHILAFSYGGEVSGAMLEAHTRRLISVNYCAPGGLEPVTPPQLERVRSKSGAERIAAHKINLHRAMIANPDKIDDLAIQIQEENTNLARLRLLRGGVRTHKRLRVVVTEVQVPMNAFWGSADQWAAAGYATRAAILQQNQKDLELNVFPGVGHWLAYEAADKLNGMLMPLIEKRTEQFAARR